MYFVMETMNFWQRKNITERGKWKQNEAFKIEMYVWKNTWMKLKLRNT
jgi:hypothetical protein